jgi:hypothetical protein
MTIATVPPDVHTAVGTPHEPSTASRRDQQVLGDHLALTRASDDRQCSVGLDMQAHLQPDEPDRHRVAGRAEPDTPGRTSPGSDTINRVLPVAYYFQLAEWASQPDRLRGPRRGRPPGVGKLQRSPTLIDVRRLPETGRVPRDDGVVAGKVRERPLPRADVGGAPCSMSRAGPMPARRYAIRTPSTSTWSLPEFCRIG